MENVSSLSREVFTTARPMPESAPVMTVFLSFNFKRASSQLVGDNGMNSAARACAARELPASCADIWSRDYRGDHPLSEIVHARGDVARSPSLLSRHSLACIERASDVCLDRVARGFGILIQEAIAKIKALHLAKKRRSPDDAVSGPQGPALA